MQSCSAFAVVVLVGCLLGMLGVAQAQPPNMVFGDDPRKPVEIDTELLCESCNAIVHVVTQKVGKKWSEDAVYSAMDKICDSKNFRVYKMIPPTMVKGCEAFLDRHGDGVPDTARSRHIWVRPTFSYPKTA
eukprot:1021312-Prorocentrum_minimum.AAC.10